jgi:hypothetical protein
MTESPGFDPFEVLGVGVDADAVVIQLAYRARIRAVHPDIAGPAGLEQAKRLNLAREWLLDPERRARLRWTTPPPPGPAPAASPREHAKGPRTWARSRRGASRGARTSGVGATSLDLGPQTERLWAFLRAVQALTPDERARVNYSLGDARPMAFDAYTAYLDARFSTWSRSLRDAVAEVWERGLDEPAPFLHPLGRIVPSGFLVANAYAQWILLGDVFRDELGDAMFRSEHVYDTFEARCRAPWEGSVGQARYGPNGQRVTAFLHTARRLPADAGTRLARAWFRHLGRDARDEPSERIGPGIWLPAPPGYPAALTVSGYLAAVDAARIAPPPGLARRDQDGFRYALRLTAHVLALGLTGRGAHAYLQPWREAVGVAV